MSEGVRTALTDAVTADSAGPGFSADVGHELRTSLNGVLGMLDLVLAGALEPGQRELLQLARSSSAALRGLVLGATDPAPTAAAPATDGPPRGIDPVAQTVPAACLGRGRRVMLVEDHPVNRTLAQRVVERAGFEVVAAEDGVVALEHLAAPAARFDVVLMDCHMPRLDGLEATRRLRALEAATGAAPVPVLALTAHASAAERTACLAAGMDDFLPKPYTPTELLAMIERHLPCGPASPQAIAHESSEPQPKAAEDESLARIDMAALQELRDALGEDLTEIVNHFLDQLDEQVQGIGSALAAGDVQAAGRQGHALKGSAGNLALAGLAALAAELEQMGKRGELEAARSRYRALQSAAAQTVSRLGAMGYSARAA